MHDLGAATTKSCDSCDVLDLIGCWLKLLFSFIVYFRVRVRVRVSYSFQCNCNKNQVKFMKIETRGRKRQGSHGVERVVKGHLVVCGKQTCELRSKATTQPSPLHNHTTTHSDSQ